MSQFWHAHWAEDGFKPTRLGNWEVPRWHAEWPDMHCKTTKCEAHKNGRIFATVRKSGSPWGNYKGTWELPAKIDRKTAEEISRSTEYKKAFWEAHRRKHQYICQSTCKGPMRYKKIDLQKKHHVSKEDIKNETDIDKKAEEKVVEEKVVEDKVVQEEKVELEKSVDEPGFGQENCEIKKACSI